MMMELKSIFAAFSNELSSLTWLDQGKALQ